VNTVLRGALLTVAVGLTATALAACGSESGETFTIEQESPKLVEVKTGSNGSLPGNILAFDAPLTRDGEPAGALAGLLTTVKVPESSGGEPSGLESRFGTLNFAFDESDSIVVSGATVYPASQAEMQVGKAQVRAIVGGTGRYSGASGQVTTTRQGSGKYLHEFEVTE